MINEYIKAVLLIFAAEMGDKTQILAMMFATRYSTKKVLIGIAIGSFLNHGLAVIFGTLLGQFIPIYLLQMVAGMAFVGFALWTLMSDDGEEVDEQKPIKKSAIVVVAMAFFLGELGDKTQLTAITLAVDATFPILILLGTVTGMLLTSSLGIVIGSKIGDKIPEILIKMISSSIFLIFGVVKLVQATPTRLINLFSVGAFIIVVSATALLLIRTFIQAHKEGQLTAYGRASKRLYDHVHKIEVSVNAICRGLSHCGQCQGNSCAIGFLKNVVKNILEKDMSLETSHLINHIKYIEGKFDQNKLTHCLKMNMQYLITLEQDDVGYLEADLLRSVLEVLLVGDTIDYLQDYEAYKAKMLLLNIVL